MSTRPQSHWPAKLTKNKKSARQPLPPGVTSQLREYLAGKPAGQVVWGGTWREKPVKVLQKDLAAAGVTYCLQTIDGPRYADFHALRHSYLSALAAAGVGVKELQELARHSDPRLTLGIYTHARADSLGASVARLPIPGDAAANPLARMTRAELESAVVALAVIVTSLFAPPLAPNRETSGDSGGLAGTDGVGGRVAWPIKKPLISQGLRQFGTS